MPKHVQDLIGFCAVTVFIVAYVPWLARQMRRERAKAAVSAYKRFREEHQVSDHDVPAVERFLNLMLEAAQLPREYAAQSVSPPVHPALTFNVDKMLMLSSAPAERTPLVRVIDVRTSTGQDYS